MDHGFDIVAYLSCPEPRDLMCETLLSRPYVHGSTFDCTLSQVKRVRSDIARPHAACRSQEAILSTEDCRSWLSWTIEGKEIVDQESTGLR